MEEKLKRAESAGERYAQCGEILPDLSATDWKNAPGIAKIYQGVQRLHLDNQPSVQSPDTPPDYGEVGQLLFDIYGLSRVLHTSSSALQKRVGNDTSSPPLDTETHFATFLLRSVPSGGALFPGELYLLVGQEQQLPAGIYHYDAAHHALDILRKGDYSACLAACLARSQDPPALAFLLSCLFWKNGYKYGEFGYRLQSLDIGVLAEQCRVVASHYQRETTLHYRFLDLSLNRLIGLEYLYESVYAVITVDIQGRSNPISGDTSALALIDNLSEPTGKAVEQPKSIARWPLLEELHIASLIKTTEELQSTQHPFSIVYPPTARQYQLPQISPLPDLLQGLHSRHSAQGWFRAHAISKLQLAALLASSVQGYSNDLDGQPVTLQHTLLYCVVQMVEGIPLGVYVYHPDRHILGAVYEADVSSKLQTMQARRTSNMAHIGVCFLPVGNYTQGLQAYGDRWYRIQNMEAGIITQGLSLAAATLGLGCQISLSYHVSKANDLLHLPESYSSLIQILIASEHFTGQSYEQHIHFS